MLKADELYLRDSLSKEIGQVTDEELLKAIKLNEALKKHLLEMGTYLEQLQITINYIRKCCRR